MIAHRSPPRMPGALPGIGHAHTLLRRPLDFLTQVTDFGSVVEIRLGSLPQYVLTDPDLIYQVLVAESHNYERGRMFEKAALFIGNGLATSSGPEHRRLRRLLQPSFRPQHFTDQHITALRTACAQTSWRASQIIDVRTEMTAIAVSAMSAFLFGAGSPAVTDATMRRAVPILVEGVLARAVAPDWVGRLPTPANRRFSRAKHHVDTITDTAIAQVRSSREGLSMITDMLLLRDEDDTPLTSEEIRSQTITFFMAGVEATASILSWVFHEMGRNKAIEQQVHNELATAVGGGLTLEALGRLDYTRRVVTEALRRYAPWLFTRKTLRPVSLGAYTIPAGAEVAFSPYTVHNDTRFYPDPAAFQPDRWLPENAKNIPRKNFIPFNAGPHRCIGEHLAYTEVITALVEIASRWRLTPMPGAAVRPVGAGSGAVRPGELKMSLTPRPAGRSKFA